MALSQKGFGVVWGVNGITFSGYTGTAYYNVQSANGDRKSERKVVLDGSGEMIGQIFFDERKSFTIQVVPTFNSATGGIAGAKASMDALTPTPGTAITIVDGDGAIFDASGPGGGVYSLISAKLSRTSTGEAVIDMELEMSVVNSGATTVLNG